MQLRENAWLRAEMVFVGLPPKHNSSALCMSSHLTTTAVIAQFNISVYTIYFLIRKCCGHVRGIAIAVPGVSSPKGHPLMG